MIAQRIAGIGFREAAGPASILDALRRAGGGELRDLALPERKARHPAVRALSRLGYTIHPVRAEDLTRATTLTESAAARAAHGTGSVSEGCALVACGPGARLLAPRSISGDGLATAAVAVKGKSE